MAKEEEPLEAIRMTRSSFIGNRAAEKDEVIPVSEIGEAQARLLIDQGRAEPAKTEKKTKKEAESG